MVALVAVGGRHVLIIIILRIPVTFFQLLHTNLTEPRWSSFKVFFTLKTMPLSVFRYQVLCLRTE